MQCKYVCKQEKLFYLLNASDFLSAIVNIILGLNKNRIIFFDSLRYPALPIYHNQIKSQNETF